MVDHYYSRQPSAAHDRAIVETTLRGRTLKFVTDAGVFSRDGIDFGSRLLIETMELASDAHVLDIGCGYGPIGISAALLAQHGQVTMADVNERALALAAENARLNNIANVKIVASDLFEQLGGEQFDAIVSNPPIRAGKATVHRLFEEAYAHLSTGGSLWVVMQKKQGSPSAMNKLEELFGQVEERNRAKGYRIMRAQKKLADPINNR